MSAALFDSAEQLLLDSARAVLSAGMERIKGRAPALALNGTKAAVEAARQSREALTMLLQLRIGTLQHEQAVACLFDAQGRLVAIEDFPMGNAVSCSISPRLLAGFICQHGASFALVAHNHPSGECSPSRADSTNAAMLAQWLEPMECCLLDSLVITADDWCAINGGWTC